MKINQIRSNNGALHTNLPSFIQPRRILHYLIYYWLLSSEARKRHFSFGEDFMLLLYSRRWWCSWWKNIYKDDCIQKQIKYIKDKYLLLFNALRYLSIENKAYKYNLRFCFWISIKLSFVLSVKLLKTFPKKKILNLKKTSLVMWINPFSSPCFLSIIFSVRCIKHFLIFKWFPVSI